MIRKLMMVVVALTMTACAAPQPEAPAGPFIGIEGRPLKNADGNIDNSVQEALTANPAACAKAGGEIRPVCMRGVPMCVVNFTDAGKTCSDSSECSGRCEIDGQAAPMQPARGKCRSTNDPCGCFQLVEKGVAGYPLCAD